MSLYQTMEKAQQTVEDINFIENIKDNNLKNNLTTNIALKEDNNENEKFSIFKKMIFFNLPKFNNSYLFKNESVFYKIGFTLSIIAKPIDRVIEIGNSISVFTKDLIEDKKRDYLIIGQKLKVLSAFNKITEEYKKTGFDLENLTADKQNFEINENDFKLLAIKNMYDLGLDDEQNFKILEISNNDSKKEIFTNVIWKKLKNNISQSVSIITVANTLKNLDPFIRNIKNISIKNNITEESLATIISADPKLLLNLKDGSIIYKELEQYINAINKYTDFINNNNYLTNFYIENVKKILEKYFSTDENNYEFIKNILDEKFVSIKGNNFSISEIEQGSHIKMEKININEEFKNKNSNIRFKKQSFVNY